MYKTDFNYEFKKRNLALYVPKNDFCDLCEGFKYGHISYIHHSRKNDARNAKELAKVFARNNSNDSASITMDFQAVKLSSSMSRG